MKKFAGILIALLFVGYFVNLYLENKAKRKAEEAKKEKVKQEKLSAISEMVSKNNAIDDWGKKLTKGKKVRTGSILTIELEKLWLNDRPILFLGSIEDIATYNKSKYKVLVERSILLNTDYMILDDLQLSLVSPKKYVNFFMDKYPKLFNNSGINNGVAIIANIDSIKNKNILGDDGESKTVKVGDGKLVDIKYLGSMSL